MSQQSTPEVVYRYVETQYAGACDEYGDPIPGDKGPLAIHLCEFLIIKHTKCGVWIEGPKFINLQRNKTFACLTKEEAVVSFLARKTRQIKILSAQLEQAKLARNAMELARGEVNNARDWKWRGLLNG